MLMLRGDGLLVPGRRAPLCFAFPSCLSHWRYPFCVMSYNGDQFVRDAKGRARSAAQAPNTAVCALLGWCDYTSFRRNDGARCCYV